MKSTAARLANGLVIIKPLNIKASVFKIGTFKIRKTLGASALMSGSRLPGLSAAHRRLRLRRASRYRYRLHEPAARWSQHRRSAHREFEKRLFGGRPSREPR